MVPLVACVAQTVIQWCSVTTSLTGWKNLPFSHALLAQLLYCVIMNIYPHGWTLKLFSQSQVAAYSITWIAHTARCQSGGKGKQTTSNWTSLTLKRLITNPQPTDRTHTHTGTWMHTHTHQISQCYLVLIFQCNISSVDSGVKLTQWHKSTPVWVLITSVDPKPLPSLLYSQHILLHVHFLNVCFNIYFCKYIAVAARQLWR